MATKPKQQLRAGKPRGKGPVSAKPKSEKPKRAERRLQRLLDRCSIKDIAPVAYSTRISQRPSSSGHASGTLVLAEISQGGGTLSSDQQVMLVNVNPFLLGYFAGGIGATVGSAITNRLSSMAMLYSQFRFKKLVLRYVPSCPTSTRGMVLVAYSQNPNMGVAAALRVATGWTNTVGSRSAGLFQEYANMPSLEFNVWSPATWQVPLDKSWKEVDPFQAIGLYAVEASAGVINGIVHDVDTSSAYNYGTIHADYELEFRMPTWTPGYASLEDAMTPTFVTTNSTAGQAQTIYFNETGVGSSTYSNTFQGPLILIPRSTLTFGSGTPQTLPAGTPVIAAVYRPAAYAATPFLALYNTLADLTAGTYIIVATGSTVSVSFEADVLAISNFGA